MYKIKSIIKKVLPSFVIYAYHYSLALIASVIYGFPSRKIKVVGVTGTKGKSSTIEYLNAIFEKAGYTTAISSTIHFKVGDNIKENKFKMTMPGRFFIQKFIKQAVDSNCDIVFIEMTSEGAKLFRHKFIALDALIFTNLSKEHIESHGSYDAYKQAKLKLGKSLEQSPKRPRFMIVNADAEISSDFLNLKVEFAIPVSIKHAGNYKLNEYGAEFVYNNTNILLKQKGKFSIYNALMAATLASAFDINDSIIKSALESVSIIPGRVQCINEGQDFQVIVDYAHTPDSLIQIYDTFKDKTLICVLGNTGGGRDKWKRKDMAEITEKYCKEIILTDEDPYDEDPMQIIKDMKKYAPRATVIQDRRRAIKTALEIALGHADSAVLITGKGTDPYIMRSNGQKEPWSDAEVARQELREVLQLPDIKDPHQHQESKF